MRLTMRRRGREDAFGRRTLWLTAAVLTATWAPQLRAEGAGPSTRPAQAQQATQALGPQTAETLARELDVAKRDLDTLLRLLNRACSAEPPGAPANLATDPGLADLRNSLHEERDRASRLEQDLAAARRDVANQTALAARASDEANRLKTTPDAGSADLRKSLQQEHDRASRLEQELAAAQRDVATQTALAAKAGDEARQLKTTADAGSADLRKSLQQEQNRASVLERDLAAARRDVETQTALAAKASDEASQLRNTADAGSADMRKSLQQERDRASVLERDLATARRDVETQTALAAKASDETKQVKKAADAGAAELHKSLQQEHERASRLGQGLASARRKFEKQIALAARAAIEASQFKKAAEANEADLRNSLQQERDRANRLEQDLAAARRDVATQTALATKASTDASQQKKLADEGAVDLRRSLQQEQERASRLEQDLATVRYNFQTQTALAEKASDAPNEATKATDGPADLRRSLQQEQERASRLEQDLATARYNLKAQTALTAKASDEASQAKKTAEGSAELGKSLKQERDRASRLEQDLAAARRDLETQTALAAKAKDDASQAKKTADGSAELRKSLQQEQDRARRLEQDLAAARRDIAAQTALAAKTSDEANQAKKAAEAASADLQKSLQQERDRAAQLERDLASARSNATVSSTATRQVQAATSAPMGQTPSTDAMPRLEDASDNARLVAYAHLLLDRGDIGSARIVLQRAADMGSAEASFALAESYDPLIPSKWGTYGTHGDTKRALELYAKALAGGIKQAKERSDALHR